MYIENSFTLKSIEDLKGLREIQNEKEYLLYCNIIKMSLLKFAIFFLLLQAQMIISLGGGSSQFENQEMLTEETKLGLPPRANSK